jgi:hypothetical protein
MSASPTAEQPAFVRTQYQFAAHIRDPQAHPAPPELEDRRMAIYRELFYNNVEGFLADGFPVLRRIYTDSDWHALVRDYFARHRSHTPYFPEIGKEFLQYLEQERAQIPGDPPFLLELAHYEWVELALSFSDADQDTPPADPNGDPYVGVPILSRVAWSLSYRFPVHRIGPELQPQRPELQPTHLVVYRNRRDQVEFLEINAVTQRLIQLLKENPDRTGQDAVTQVATELQHPQPELVHRAGRQLLQDLRARDIVLGTRLTRPSPGA